MHTSKIVLFLFSYNLFTYYQLIMAKSSVNIFMNKSIKYNYQSICYRRLNIKINKDR